VEVIRPRVLLADDHVMMTEGLRSILSEECDVVGVVADGRALVAAARTLSPDVIVADISMPHLSGLDALVTMRKENPQVKVIFLTMHQNPAYARKAFQAGAAGFLVKHAAAAELTIAIKAVLTGKTYITPILAKGVLQEMQRGPRGIDDLQDSLTPRQREILQLLAEGRSVKQIASDLAISTRTVEFHKYQIMDAHGLRSTAELIHFAIKNGIVTL
jgi:DNA-binding NarL/FixJ family response regulator